MEPETQISDMTLQEFGPRCTVGLCFQVLLITFKFKIEKYIQARESVGSCELGTSIDGFFRSEMFFPLLAVPSWRSGWSLHAGSVSLVHLLSGEKKKKSRETRKRN